MDSPSFDTKLPINGIFDNEEVTNAVESVTFEKKLPLKYFIDPHPGFERKRMPDGSVWKIAYDDVFPESVYDHEIEESQINKFWQLSKSKDPAKAKEGKRGLIFHYKKAISLYNPEFAKGWNRWSEQILEMFVDPRKKKVLWGSGNCGKSVTEALLLYITWRLNPPGIMVIIATLVVKEAGARVWGYVKKFHKAAPPCSKYVIDIIDNREEKGIFHYFTDTDGKKRIKNDLAGIIPLPIKKDAARDEYGGNLLGKHPSHRLIIGFDECQELPAVLLQMKIYANWETNKHFEVHAWGNPIPVDFHQKDTHDLLFHAAAGHLTWNELKKLELQKEETFLKLTKDMAFLHLTMKDSPKDDPEEKAFKVVRNGLTEQRLEFLGGEDSLKAIVVNNPPGSPAYYSQVLGFPFINLDTNKSETCFTPYMVKIANEYPLRWRNENELLYFLGLDPSQSGLGDKCVIVVFRVGMMLDGRLGVDFMNGEHCYEIEPCTVEGEHYEDKTLDEVYRLAEKFNIPLSRISIEPFGSGSSFGYAMDKKIEATPIWAYQKEKGLNYYESKPREAVTEMMLFDNRRRLQKAKDLVKCCITEDWVAMRCGVESRQFFNIPDSILKDGYTREFAASSGAKRKIEDKTTYKKRVKRSTDYMDAAKGAFKNVRLHFKWQYQFTSKFGYVEKYGEQYTKEQEKQIVQHRMNTAMTYLGLGNSTGVSEAVKRKKRYMDYV